MLEAQKEHRRSPAPVPDGRRRRRRCRRQLAGQRECLGPLSPFVEVPLSSLPALALSSAGCTLCPQAPASSSRAPQLRALIQPGADPSSLPQALNRALQSGGPPPPPPRTTAARLPLPLHWGTSAPLPALLMIVLRLLPAPGSSSAPAMRALVRGLAGSFASAVTMEPLAEPISLELARQQHEAYVQLLQQLLPGGVTELPADDRHPGGWVPRLGHS